MTTQSPVAYRPDVEQPLKDERETIEELNATFDVILHRTHEDYGHAVRAVHAKSHGVLQGKMTVNDGLAPELAQGLFAKPGAYKVLLRLSTNAGDILPDSISLPRGLAIKILEAPGERLPGSEGTAQDFIFVNGTIFAAPTAKKFLGNLKLLAKTTDKLEGTKKALSAALRAVHNVLAAVGTTVPAIDSLGGAPNVEPLGETYSSVTPFRYGDFIAKFRLKPVTPQMKALTGSIVPIEGRENAIRETVQGEMGTMVAEWDFQVQLCRDLEKQPIEDATVEWKEADAPFATVARLRAPAQDSWSPEGVNLIDEQTRFSVWTGLASHQPLGNVNRARKATYRHSADFRAGANHCPYREP